MSRVSKLYGFSTDKMIRRIANRHPIRCYSSTPLPVVPLWIGGEAVSSSSAGTIMARHAKTRRESCEVVMAGEEET